MMSETRTRRIFFHCSPYGDSTAVLYPLLNVLKAKVRGREAKLASCFLSTSCAILGQVMGMTWTPPSLTHAMSDPNSLMRRWIHRNAGFSVVSNISGRLPTMGHGTSPSGSGAVHLLFRLHVLIRMIWTRYASITTRSNTFNTGEQCKETPTKLTVAAASTSISMLRFTFVLLLRAG
jgi:hypothetical protein